MRRLAFVGVLAATTALILGSLSGAAADDDDGGDELLATKYLKCAPVIDVSVQDLTSVRVVVKVKGIVAAAEQAPVPDSLLPEPTATPEPTSTPEPTVTPEPTATPEPTGTPTASTSAEPTTAADPSATPTTSAEPPAPGVQTRVSSDKTEFCPGMKVTITAVDTATGKEIFRKSKTRNWWILSTKWAVEFKAARGVKVKVTAEHSGGAVSDEVTMPDVPGTVTGLHAPTTTDTQATLVWTAADSRGDPVIDYAVEVDGKTYRVTGTSLTVSGLRPEAKYLAKVRAHNRLGDGAAASVEFATRPTPKAPGQPRDLRILPIMDTERLASDWNAPATDGGSPITGYEAVLRWTVDGTTYAEDYAGTDSSVLWRAKLRSAQKYTVQVRARNAVGASEWLSKTITSPLKPVDRPKTAPSEPLDPTIADVSRHEMRVTWKAPRSDGGSPITHYIVEWRSADQDMRREFVTPKKLEAFLVGLEAGTNYAIAIQAMNKEGLSPAATVESFTNMEPVQTPKRPSVPLNPKAAFVSTEVIGLQWSPPASDGGAAILHYLVTDETGRVVQSEIPFASFGGYTADTLHTFTIRAVNGMGPSKPATITVRTNMDPVPTPEVPTAPRDLTVVSVTTRTIALTWVEPASDGGAALEGYRVNYGGATDEFVTATSIVLTGLEPVTTYPISVVAVNGMGAGPAVSLEATTNIDPVPRPQKPSVPRNVRVTGVTESSVALDWIVPASDGGAPIVGYSVGVAGGTPMVVTGTAAIVSGLAPNREYTLEVRALNTTDESDAVAVKGRTATATPAPAPAPTPFSPPRPGDNTDGSLDLDGRAKTVRQTSPGKWPRVTTVRTGSVTPIASKSGFVTNAGQVAGLRVAYRSPSIQTVRIRLNPKTQKYTFEPRLKSGTVSGSVVLTVSAPSVTVGGVRYEPLSSSRKFVVKRVVKPVR